MCVSFCKVFSRLQSARLIGCLGLLILFALATASLAGTISGTVTQYGGGALSGAVVRTEGEPSYSATTGTNGSYSLTLPSGAFVVLASKSGYDPQRMSVPSGAGTVNFALYTASTGQTVSLPAPLACGEPPSAPTAPGDSYPIAFADTGALPSSGAPRISGYNECIKPNESFTMTGADFTTRTGADAGTDTTVWVWARTSTNQGTLRQATLWRASANTVVATMPDDIPFGMYVVWVENSVGASAPICINKPRTTWVGPIDNNTYAGGTKRVFGKNLSYGHGTSQSYVYIQPAAGGAFTQCSVTSVEPYAVGLTIPVGTANGNYKVFVHNGQGGVYGWSDGLDLVVGTQWVRGTGQINLTSNGTDDSTQIQNAINTASGYTNGGVVQLGSGNYIVKADISLATNVELKGLGMNSTTVLLEPGSVTVTGDRAALSNLTLHQVYGYTLQDHEFKSTAGSGVVLSGVRIDSDQGDSNWQNLQSQTWILGVELKNCEMHREVTSQWNSWIHDNNLYGDVGPWYEAESACTLWGRNNVFEDNHVETLNWPVTNGLPNYAWYWQDPLDPTSTLQYRTWAKRAALCYCDCSYIAHNTGQNIAVDDNRGEMILFHGHESFWCGQILSTNGLTMTVRTDGTVFGQTYTIPNTYGPQLTAGGTVADSWIWWAYANGSRNMVIIAGKGAGQVRSIPNNGINPPDQITVDRPWAVEPDSTSVALFTGFWSDNIVYGNELNAFPSGFSFDPSLDYSNLCCQSGGYASAGVLFDGSNYHEVAEGNITRRTNYGREILAYSGGPSLWNEMRDEQAIDCNSTGYQIRHQGDANPLGPILFGNVFRNCSGNVAAAGWGGAVTGVGEGTILENVTMTAGVGYCVGYDWLGNSGTPVLYRNGNVTVNNTTDCPAYIRQATGKDLLINNTYSGASSAYVYNTGGYGYGASSYSLPTPLYKVARFTASSGSGTLSAALIPIANAGTSSMTWSVASGSPWITASIQAGGTMSAESTSGSLSIVPDTTGMSVGRHWGSVTVYTTSGSVYPTVLSVKIGVVVDITSSTQVAAPTFNPPSDVAGTHSVTIGTMTSGATIRYTTNGNTPTSSSGTVYSGAFSVGQGTVVKAIAYKAGMTDSVVTSVAAAAPTVNLASGEYAGPHSVTISTITSGATIRYTTDGTVPTSTTGTVYGGSVVLSSTCVLKAIAYKTGMADSDVTSVPYTIANQTWSLAGDFSSSVQGNNGWYYGVENYLTQSQPTFMCMFESPRLWTGSYPDYFIDCTPAAVLWGGGNYYDAALYYALQTTSLSKYAIGQNIATLGAGKVGLLYGKARWVAPMDGDYTYNATFSRLANGTTGVFMNIGDLNTGTKSSMGAAQYFSTTNSAYSYSGTQHLGAGQFLEFVTGSTDAGGYDHYNDIYMMCLTQVDATISCGSGSTGTVAAPTFNPAAGTYASTQSVAISTTTGGATIRYTTDGSTPTSSYGTVYGSAVNISSSCTLNAIAYKGGMTDSSVASGAYTILIPCATPTFSPAEGTYTSAQSVTISCSTSGATIRYTTDGTDPTGSSTVYSSAINVASTTTLKAKAFKSGMADSSVASAVYTITGTGWVQVGSTFGPYSTPDTILSATGFSSTVDMPTELLVSGGAVPDQKVTYTLSVTGVSGWGAQRVGDSGLALYLANTPADTLGLFTGVYCDSNGAAYEGALVSDQANIQPTTVSADAYTFDVTNVIQSGVATNTITGINNATYTVTSTDITNWNGKTKFAVYHSSPGWPWAYAVATASNIKFYKWGSSCKVETPTMSPDPAVTYTDSVDVSMSCSTTGATIRYTTDGTDPTGSSTAYSSAVTLSLNTTVKAKAFKSGMTDSDTATAAYSVKPQTPTFSPVAGNYSSAQSVTISCASGGTTIRYTTDGSTPTSTYGTVYSSTVSITQNTTLKAIAYKSGMTDSTVASGDYTINCSAPTFNPVAGNYPSAQSVTISSTTGGVTIRYTTDGSTPTSSTGTVYGSAVSISQNTTLKAIAYKSAMADSSVTSGDYTIACASPTFNPTAGTYTGTQSVTIGSTTGGATIRYTTNGTTPSDTVGTVYSGAVSIDQNTTLKAIAYKSGMGNSSVTSGDYTIQIDTPTFSPAAGTYSSAQSVTISCTTSSATIRYTTDGTDPTGSSTVYPSAINVASTTTLKAKAFKSGMADSAIGSAAYTITSGTWVQVGSTIAGPYVTPDAYIADTGFSSVSTVPSGIGISGGVLNDFKVTYTLDVFAVTGWGPQQIGDGGLALFVGSTPSATLGLFTGCQVSAIGTDTAGTFASDASGASVSLVSTGTPTSFNVTVTCVDGIVTTTVAGLNSYSYTPTSSDITSWTGNTGFTAFHSGPGWPSPYVRSSISNITFYNRGGVQTVSTPTMSPDPAVTYTDSVLVSMDCATTGATIRYTTDGTAPSGSSTAYSSAVTLSQNTTVKAKAFNSGMTDSDTATAAYSVKPQTPTFNPTAGTYTGTQSVTIGSTTGGVTIRYTTDGSTPTSTTGTVYSSAVSITQNCTLKAIAYKSGMTDSTVASGAYTISCVAPTFNPVAGTYGTAQSVTIASTTSGASIRYTTDGTTPSDTVGTAYSSAVSITANCTLKAIAYRSNMGNSTVTSGAYSYFIGNNTVGGSNQSFSSGRMYAARFQAPGAFTASSILVDIATSPSNKHIKCAIYSDSSGSPGSFLMGTNELTNPGTGWKTFTLTSGQSLTSGTYYWLTMWVDGNYAVKGDSTGGTYKWKSQSYGTWPSSFGTAGGSGTIKFSIYAQ